MGVRRYAGIGAARPLSPCATAADPDGTHELAHAFVGDDFRSASGPHSDNTNNSVSLAQRSIDAQTTRAQLAELARNLALKGPVPGVRTCVGCAPDTARKPITLRSVRRLLTTAPRLGRDARPCAPSSLLDDRHSDIAAIDLQCGRPTTTSSPASATGNYGPRLLWPVVAMIVAVNGMLSCCEERDYGFARPFLLDRLTRAAPLSGQR